MVKITQLLKEKALATARIMSIEESQKDIPETPFFVSRACKTDNGLLIAQIEINGNALFIYQKI